MNVSEELIQHINDRAIPNKDDILRAKAMAAELVSGISDAGQREEMRRTLHNAYLNLQLANVADDGQMTVKYREECVRLIHVIAALEPTGNGATLAS